jgi:hypothetical protein
MCFARRYEVRNTKQRGGDTIMQSTWYRAAIVSAVLLALGVGPALAGDEKTKSSGGAGDTYRSSEQPTAPGSSPAGKSEPAASPKTEAAGDFTGRHTMAGEVTKVDQNKGTVSVKTAEGTLDLHFPPSALANIKKGDRVSVELALKHEMSGGTMSPRSQGTPKR